MMLTFYNDLCLAQVYVQEFDYGRFGSPTDGARSYHIYALKTAATYALTATVSRTDITITEAGLGTVLIRFIPE